MPRPWTASRVAGEVARHCNLVPDTVSPRGYLTWEDGQIRRSAHFYRDKHDSTTLLWQVVNQDEKYAAMMEAGIALTVQCPVADRPQGLWDARIDGYSWPMTRGHLDHQLLADLSSYLRPSLNFVKDRRDLGYLLLQEGDVHRDDIFVRLQEGDSPARLVKAVTLSRDMPDPELEQEALDKLERRRADQVYSGTYGYWVAHWAKEDAPLVDVSLQDLYRRKGRRSKG